MSIWIESTTICMFKEVLDELGVATKADLEKLKEDLK